MFDSFRSLDLKYHYSMGHKYYDDIFDEEGETMNTAKLCFFLLPTSSPQASWPVFENVATPNQTKQSLQYKYRHSAIFLEDVSVKTLKIRSPADFSLLPSSSLSWYWCDRLLLYHYDKNNTWFCMIACNAYMTPLDL